MANIKSKRNLEILAKSLALNYINASIEQEGDRDNDLKEIANLDFKDGSDVEGVDHFLRWGRVILVVGAGLSYNAFHDIPLAQQAIDILYKKFVFGKDAEGNKVTFFDIVRDEDASFSEDTSNGFKHIRDKYMQELNNLRLYNIVRGLQKGVDFETSLALLSHFFPTSQIRDCLQEMYSKRFGPTLYHDIISHLFKHRFIDIVINFNFDELLDQSIEDELGKNTYISIISDGDCRPMSDLLISRKLKQPLYIKPHGTFSHKSTMRFTKDQYDQLPYDMSRLLEDTIICKNDDGLAPVPILIVVGFALASIEFNEILAKVESDFAIFYFYYDSFQEAQDLVGKVTKGKVKFYPICVKDFVDENDESTEYDVLFQELWTSINRIFLEYFKPRGIGRHKIIQSIFGNRSFWRELNKDLNRKDKAKFSYPESYFNSADYFKDRAAIEVVLEAFKLNGYVSIEYLLESKAGAYFYRYYFESTRQDAEQENILSFVEFLRAIGFEVDYVNNLCKMRLNFDKQYILNSEALSDFAKKQIIEKHDELTNLIVEFKNSRKSVISIDYNSRYYLSYNKYATHQLLTTNLSLEYELLKRFKKSWTHLLVIEDSGLTLELYKNRINANIGSVTTILADRSIYYQDKDLCKKMEKEFQNTQFNPILFLPSQVHDHHMIIFANINTGEIDSIYYQQKGLSNTINPIVVSEKKNLEALLQIFTKYFEDAIRFSEIEEYDFGKVQITTLLK